MNAIAAEHLTHRYAKATTDALSDVSFNVPRGSCFGILGPNGAGKTTLLSLLTGLVPLQQGSIRILDRDLKLQSHEIKKISAIAPQDLAFYLNLTGRENLNFFADIYGLSATQSRQRLDYCAQVCQLTDVLDQRADQYSGGTKRRLNLAIAMLNAPQLLYLDEPTVGIDVVSRQLILDAIKALRASGVTVIYTSHYLEEVEALCDEVLIINHGKVLARRSMMQMLAQGQQQTLQITLSAPATASLLSALQRWQPRAHDNRLILTMADANSIGEVVTLCQQQDFSLLQMQFGISRLESLYVELLNAGDKT